MNCMAWLAYDYVYRRVVNLSIVRTERTSEQYWRGRAPEVRALDYTVVVRGSKRGGTTYIPEPLSYFSEVTLSRG